jgi:hypothetical protein
MARYVIHHRHEPRECGVAFASFRGHASPLRGRAAFASCRSGGHEVWWLLEAGDPGAALAQLPFFVARRSTVTEIHEVLIP